VYARRSFVLAVVVLAVLAAGTYYAAPRIGPTDHATAFDEKLAAAKTMESAEMAILDARREQADSSTLADDPTVAAMLGLPTSPITTDSGSLTSKMTSTNPNFAALIVDFLRDAGVRQNDLVAVAYTGSFPALDIGTIAAIEAMGADPIIVSSVGASTWGANDPEFTILDMETLLASKGIINHRSVAASVGGDFRVHRLSDEARALAALAIKRNDVPYLNGDTLTSSIQQRMDTYDQQAGGRSIKAFINVGGGLVSTGAKSQPQFDPGLTVGPAQGDVEAQGLLYGMQQRNVPIVNLTDIKQLAKTYQFTVSPRTLPSIGEGTPWNNWTSVRIRAGIAAALILFAALGLRLFVISPSGKKEFDSYFGFVPARLHSAASKLRHRLLPTRPSMPPPDPEAEA
jgi:poly-gamma-glutamate system protein